MRISIMLLTTVAALALQPSYGQTQRSGNDNARIMSQLQTVSADKMRLQTENEELKKQLEELKAKSSKASGDQLVVQQQRRELESSRALQKESADELEKLKGRMQELIGKYRELATQLQGVEAERDQFKTSLAARERDFKSCVDRNAGLYFLNDEILRRLEDRSFWSKASEKEPFTQIARTRMENLIDDYRDRVEELRVSRKTTATH
jgi:chromosome segregation ATPase